MSIDDYLDVLLSGSSEPSSKAIKKLTKLLENFGAIMVASTERMEDYITGLDARISAIERNLGVSGPTLASPALASPAQASAPAMANPAQASAPAMGAPNLSAAPNLSSAPSGGGSPAPAPSGGGGISNSDLMKAAAGLSKAPEQQPKEMVDAASFSPSGVSVTAIQGVKAGLKKVDQDEHRKERAAAAGESGSMPASMVLNMEVKDALAKRKSRSKSADDSDDEDDELPTQVAPAAPKRSTKQMKEALQGELRDAFSSLLESDTKEEEE